MSSRTALCEKLPVPEGSKMDPLQTTAKSLVQVSGTSGEGNLGKARKQQTGGGFGRGGEKQVKTAEGT